MNFFFKSNSPAFSFFDVETPNCHNDRICSIGIIQTDVKGNVVNHLSYLVNPEASFDEPNMRVHGIAPIDVETSPLFPELWKSSLSDVFEKTKVVAYNASFDLSVIWKCLDDYELQIPDLQYVCAMKMMQAAHPGLLSYKLPAACAYYNIALGKHHEALSDALACKDVFWSIVGESEQLPRFSSYEYCGSRSCDSTAFHISFSDETKNLRTMKKLAEKVLEDGKVSLEEASLILMLSNVLPELAANKAISPVLSIIEEAVVDGQIDENESSEIVKALGRFVDPVASSEKKTSISFDGKNFVLSGNFKHGSKDAIGSLIESKGGIVIKGVTKKCDYVVVGGCGNENWSMGNYGNKVKKALCLQEEGIPVDIISENDLFLFV